MTFLWPCFGRWSGFSIKASPLSCRLLRWYQLWRTDITVLSPTLFLPFCHNNVVFWVCLFFLHLLVFVLLLFLLCRCRGWISLWWRVVWLLPDEAASWDTLQWEILCFLKPLIIRKRRLDCWERNSDSHQGRSQIPVHQGNYAKKDNYNLI